MVINKAPTVSLYSLVEHASPHNIFTGDRMMLARLSAQIEHNMRHSQTNSHMFSGFQQMKYLAPVFDRYTQIAQTCKAVWVFGTPDATYPHVDNLNYVTLDEDHPFRREWFVVVNDHAHKRALIAEELTEPGTPHKDRVFDGILTSDPLIVDLMYQHLLAMVETIAY